MWLVFALYQFLSDISVLGHPVVLLKSVYPVLHTTVTDKIHQSTLWIDEIDCLNYLVNECNVCTYPIIHKVHLHPKIGIGFFNIDTRVKNPFLSVRPSIRRTFFYGNGVFLSALHPEPSCMWFIACFYHISTRRSWFA